MMFKSVLLILVFLPPASAFAESLQIIMKEAKLEHELRRQEEMNASQRTLQLAHQADTNSAEATQTVEADKQPEATDGGAYPEKKGLWTRFKEGTGNFLFGRGVVSEEMAQWPARSIPFIITNYSGPEGLSKYAQRYHKSDEQAAIKAMEQLVSNPEDRQKLGWWELQNTSPAPVVSEKNTSPSEEEKARQSQEEFNQEMSHLAVPSPQVGSEQQTSRSGEAEFVSRRLSISDKAKRKRAIVQATSQGEKVPESAFHSFVELLLERTLSPGSVKAIKNVRSAHTGDIGKDLVHLARPGNYTPAQIENKVKMLAQAGFSQEEVLTVLTKESLRVKTKTHNDPYAPPELALLEPVDIQQEVPSSLLESVSFQTPKVQDSQQTSNNQARQSRREKRQAKLQKDRAEKKQKKRELKEKRQQQALLQQTTLGVKTSEGSSSPGEEPKQNDPVSTTDSGKPKKQGTIVTGSSTMWPPRPEEGSIPPPPPLEKVSAVETTSSEVSSAAEEGASVQAEANEAAKKEEVKINVDELGVLSKDSFLELSYRDDNALENTALGKAVLAGDREAYHQALSAVESSPALGRDFFMDKVVDKKTSTGTGLLGLMLEVPQEKSFFTAQMLGILLALPVSATGRFRLHGNEQVFTQKYHALVSKLVKQAKDQNHEEAYHLLDRLEKWIDSSNSDAKTKMSDQEAQTFQAEVRDLVAQKDFQTALGSAERKRAFIGLVATGAGAYFLMLPPEVSEPLVQAVSRYTGIADVSFHAAEALPLVAGLSGVVAGTFSTLTGTKKCIDAFKAKRKVKRELRKKHQYQLLL